jgi:ankyrin repeat protein
MNSVKKIYSLVSQSHIKRPNDDHLYQLFNSLEPQQINKIYNKHGITLFMLTISKYPYISLENIKVLLDKGANVNQQTSNGNTVFFYLLDEMIGKQINEGDLSILELLFSYGADVNMINVDGITPLIYAIKENFDIRIIKLFLKHGCNVNFQNFEGYTPLMFATIQNIVVNNIPIIKLLLENGAEVHLQTKIKDTVIHKAIKNRTDNTIEILDLFLQYGAYINAVNQQGNNCLLELIDGFFEKEKDLNMMKYLLDNGADVNYVNPLNNLTPLILTIRNRLGLEAIEILIQYGAHLNYEDHNNTILLAHACIYHPDPNIIQCLIDHGADVNFRNSVGQTTLIILIEDINNPRLRPYNELPDDKMIEFLIQKGANVNIQDIYGSSPLHYIVNYDMPMRIKIINLLLKNGANINIQNDNGDTPLILACSHKYSDISLLITQGADVNLVNYDMKTPLITAASTAINDDMYEIIKLLLQAGALVNSLTIRGNNALMSLHPSNIRTAELLLDYHATIPESKKNWKMGTRIIEPEVRDFLKILFTHKLERDLNEAKKENNRLKRDLSFIETSLEFHPDGEAIISLKDHFQGINPKKSKKRKLYFEAPF